MKKALLGILTILCFTFFTGVGFACDSDCKCGCQEGKPCTCNKSIDANEVNTECNCKKECNCSKNCTCGCKKRKNKKSECSKKGCSIENCKCKNNKITKIFKRKCKCNSNLED